MNQEFRKTSAPYSNRQQLKDAVQANHAMAESAWIFEGRFLSRSHYVAFLTTLLRAHQCFGLPAALHLRSAASFRLERERISALEHDLRLPPETPPEALILSRSYAWGVAYVLNGSCLGAAILMKTGAVRPDWPCAYMQCARAFVSSGNLRSFFKGLNACTLDLRDALQGAADVFELFARTQWPSGIDELAHPEDAGWNLA